MPDHRSKLIWITLMDCNLVREKIERKVWSISCVSFSPKLFRQGGHPTTVGNPMASSKYGDWWLDLF
jgi:hypothetical protein